MTYNLIRQYKRGAYYEILFDVFDDTGQLLVGGLTRQVGPVELSVTELDALFADCIFPELAESNKKDQDISETVTDFERDLLEKKRTIKDKVIYQIKVQALPTTDSVITAIPEYDSDFIAYLLKEYINASYNRGYIAEPTWDAFVVDIKNTSVEDLEARR